MATTTIIDLLRHGEPRGGQRFRGRTDDPLSERGWDQMWSALGGASPWDVIVSSPLQRCADFARELSRRHCMPLVCDERLQEMDFGQWEGQTAQTIADGSLEHLSRFWTDPLAHPPPGGESLESFRERVILSWNTHITQHLGKHLLLIVHGGTIRVILSHILGIPVDRILRLEVLYASLSRVEVENDPRDDVFPRLMFHAGRL